MPAARDAALRPERKMDCRELIEWLSEYVDGGLDPLERTRFDEHLAECEDCASYLDSFRTTLRMLRLSKYEDSSQTATMPELLRAAILAARNID